MYFVYFNYCLSKQKECYLINVMLCSLYLFLCPIYCIYYTTNESPVIVFCFGWIQLIFVCFNKHRILHARRICEWFTLWWSVAIMRTRFVQNYNNWIMLLCICSYFYCNMMICTAVYAISISSSLLISLNDFDLTIIELRQQKRVASRRLLRT